MNAKPRLAITLGDPAGVGPEVIAAAWSSAAVHDVCQPLVVGRPEILRRAVALMRSPAAVVEIAEALEANPKPNTIPCLSAGSPAGDEVRPAAISPQAGQAAYDALASAVQLARTGRVDGIVTAPINKAALNAAGYHYPGHTELLAALCGVEDSAMMLYLPPGEGIGGHAGLGVVHATLHVALRDVPRLLTRERIVTCAHWATEVMFGLDAAIDPPGCRWLPRIGVCALNPHAGEEGLFGDEEKTIIEPAIKQADAVGIHIEGPLPADTLMVRARNGEFDAVVAMFHDQGHIALKLMGMHRAVNITLGLPIIRTSVAHGTAFDRAWQGTAESSGMVEAIRVAAMLARTMGQSEIQLAARWKLNERRQRGAQQ